MIVLKWESPASQGDSTFAYDCMGNMTQRIEGGVTYTQYFNAENRLTMVIALSGTAPMTTTLVYDGDGHRVLQTRSDGTTVAYVNDLLEVETAPYFYVMPRPSGSSMASGAVAANGSRGSVTAFVGGAARLPFTHGPVALGDGEGESGGGVWLTRTTQRFYYHANGQSIAMREVVNGGTNTVYYLHHDHLGSITLVTDALGGVVYKTRYWP